jgi:hypothetical protein
MSGVQGAVPVTPVSSVEPLPDITQTTVLKSHQIKVLHPAQNNEGKRKLAIFVIVAALIIAVAVMTHKPRSEQATSDGDNSNLSTCSPFGGFPADPRWQSCWDQNYAALMQQLKRASVDPISAPHKEIVDLTIKDADEIYRIARDQYLKGYKEKNESLSATASLQETIVWADVDNAVILFNKSNSDFTNNLGEYAVGRVGDARKHYESAAASLAAYSLRPDLSVSCDTSIESLRQELDQGIKQISLVEHLDAKSDPEEYYLRVNYGDMLITNVRNKLTCYESSAANIQDQPQVQTQGFSSAAAGSVAPSEPTPVPVEDSKPSAYQVTPASTTPTESQSEAALGNVNVEVSRALENWAKANESNDPTLLANCYADEVDRYFLRQNVSNTFVHDYMDAWLKEHDSRVTMFKIKDVTFQNETAATVQLRLVKEVVTTNSKGAAERFTPSQLSLKKVAGEWKITSERDFK